MALPVHVSTTFIRDPDNQYRTGYSYGRPDNATVRQTEAVIAALEGAHEALMFGSGMAAATSAKRWIGSDRGWSVRVGLPIDASGNRWR